MKVQEFVPEQIKKMVDETDIENIVRYLNSDQINDPVLKKQWEEVKDKIRRLETLIKQES